MGDVIGSAWLLAAGVFLDLIFGDPEYPFHPVRLIGWTLSRFEALLWRIGWNGYGGGSVLFLLLSSVWIGLLCFIPFWPFQLFVIYSLLALRDLLHHGRCVDRADEAGARLAVARLVGRDTDRMDLAACRRAAIESLSENLTDGFVSPIFWYAVGGLPGLVLFKVISTMDSMVGYKTDRYLKFGWCGARTDDLMNWVPARLTWLLLSACAGLLPRYSGSKALRVGWQQHAIVPGPNSGWSEAAMAGALERRLIGPLWSQGQLITELWLGNSADPPAGAPGDFRRAAILATGAGLTFAALACLAIAWYRYVAQVPGRA